MISKFKVSLVLALALALALSIPALAGGWAVITLDELPSGVIAGDPFTVGFTVLQHGRTPMTDLDPTILAESSAGEKFIVLAKPEGKPGHYAATITFPSEGDWEWKIQAFTMEQKMPTLSVAAPVSASVPVAKTQPAEAQAVSLLLIVRALALGIGLVGLLFVVKKRSRIAIALTALCLTVGIGSFMVGSAVPAVEAVSESPAKVVSDESISQVELGQQLFVAKGCITCHVNANVPNSDEYWTIDPEGATNLTNFSASPEVLRIRLKNPKDAKSNTQMPKLNLSDAEIEALIAFINSK